MNEQELKNWLDVVIEDIGRIKEKVSSQSKGLKTEIRQHERGFSVVYYRRYFEHLGGVEIQGSSRWEIARYQAWRTLKLCDILDPIYEIKPPKEKIQGDIDD